MKNNEAIINSKKPLMAGNKNNHSEHRNNLGNYLITSNW